jgi:putative ABC transport system substrate-binding protein
MKRRRFITLLGGAAAWPLAARAQQPTLPVIGFLSSELPDVLVYPSRMRGLREGLSETGFVEGRNVAFEYRLAEGRNGGLPARAAELVRQQVAVIWASGVAAALAAKSATKTTPIVFSTGGDPVQLGLVASFNRPGGNLTGIVSIGNLIAPKQLEFVHELVPTANPIAFLVNPSNPNTESDTKNMQAAARTSGQQMLALKAGTDGEIDAAFTTLVQQRAGALLVQTDPLFNRRADRIAALATSHAVPAIASYREFVSFGGLISYGSNIEDDRRSQGKYVGRILKGENPADLPVMQSAKFELVINLKTAKTIGLRIPESFLLRADEVIE